MERKKTFTMNWEGLPDDDDDLAFFESTDRISTAAPSDLASSDSEEEFEDSRLSFASTMSSGSLNKFGDTPAATFPVMTPDYSIWMTSPGSITERRNNLLKGMGLVSAEKAFQRIASCQVQRAVSKKVSALSTPMVVVPVTSSPSQTPLLDEEQKKEQRQEEKKEDKQLELPQTPSPVHSQSPVAERILLVRSRSEGEIDAFSFDKLRKEELIGKVSKQCLTRTHSEIAAPRSRMYALPDLGKNSPKEAKPKRRNGTLSSIMSTTRIGAFFLIKNLDTGKEFIVNENNEDGMWNRLSDMQTGKKLTMEEFEKTVGHSRVVKELMRRECVSRGQEDGRKFGGNSYFSRSLRLSKRGGAALLKNIKGVAHSMSGFIGERERDAPPLSEHQKSISASSPSAAPPAASQWIKVRLHGKTRKDLTALQQCQEIQAHEGSIWTLKFSLDSHYLASAGEDRVIHVWEVQECEVMSSKHHDEGSNIDKNSKKGKGRKGNSAPDYAQMPETVFSISEKPFCSFEGHKDDVLDISWYRNLQLLSASMDKTVKLWDLETKSCLKTFAHSDYVTCIQFNPIDDEYFISGSLDAKIRIWSITNRSVVDWVDVHEMITAVCYTPDGQGALVGSSKGNYRTYSIEDGKLKEVSQLLIQRKKKSQPKKITGFQFVPGSPSEVLATSADSRVRILDGTDVIVKFKGLRNTNSQISASFTQDGKYIVSASEDSQVFLWRREEHRNSGTTKNRTFVSRYECFPCKEVSIAIPWNGTVRGEPPPMPWNSKKQSKRIPPQPLSATNSPTKEDHSTSKRLLPPLPKKNNTTEKGSIASDLSPQKTPPEEELSRIAYTEAGVGESSNSPSASARFGESPSISSSASASITHDDSLSNLSARSASISSSWSDGANSHGTAWGMVIVTGGLGGEIRAYQNFGIPRRFQNTLF